MNKTHLLAIALALIAAPASLAHTDGLIWGTPKAYCEDVKGDRTTHDYGPGLSWAYSSGAIDASIPPCPYDPQWDGHWEFAVGGGIFLACAVDCGWWSDGDGALLCYDTYADHEGHVSFEIYDQVLTPLGLMAHFYVAADYNLAESECGDGIIQPCGSPTDVAGVTCNPADGMVLCFGVCDIPFPPGEDGSYIVFVEWGGTLGHITTDPDASGVSYMDGTPGDPSARNPPVSPDPVPSGTPPPRSSGGGNADP